MLFKVVNSTNPQWNDVQIPMETDMLGIGASVNFLGLHLKVTQWGGGVLILSGKNDVITLQEVPEVIEKPKITILDRPEYLRINHEVDIFFESKEIRLNLNTIVESSKLTEEYGLTYDALYEMLKTEWDIISKSFPEFNTFIMEHEPNTNNYCFLNDWGWMNGKEGDYTLLLKDGCWSRKSVDGRHI